MKNDLIMNNGDRGMENKITEDNSLKDEILNVHNKKKYNMSAFDIDNRVELKIEKELAINLGKVVLSANTNNTALLAIGHQLANLGTKK